MNAETWLQKAERLQCALASREDAASVERERITIALWLRREFGDMRQEDVPPADVPDAEAT